MSSNGHGKLVTVNLLVYSYDWLITFLYEFMEQIPTDTGEGGPISFLIN